VSRLKMKTRRKQLFRLKFTTNKTPERKIYTLNIIALRNYQQQSLDIINKMTENLFLLASLGSITSLGLQKYSRMIILPKFYKNGIKWKITKTEKICFTFLTPRIFFALFFLSFICFLDFSTFESSPFCNRRKENKE